MIRLAIMAPASTMGDLRNTTPLMDPLVICGALSRVPDSLGAILICMLCSPRKCKIVLKEKGTP